MPRLGEKYEFEVEEISRSREEYQSAAYRGLGPTRGPGGDGGRRDGGPGAGHLGRKSGGGYPQASGTAAFDVVSPHKFEKEKNMLKVRFFLNEPNGKP